MDKYLNQLAKQILLADSHGLSKVRFAKIIYFIHKGLVQKGQALPQELEFIRMPLGPVPVGFMELGEDEEISISSSKSGLSYDAQVYSLKTKELVAGQKDFSTIQQLLQQLASFSTSQLVEESHREPSWQKLNNGQKYYLSPEDLAKPVPQKKGKPLKGSLENQHLQAQLLEGMLNEIVDESTELEYPIK